MFQLPQVLQGLIYEFDNTKKDNFDNVLSELNCYFIDKIDEIKKKSAYLSIMYDEFIARHDTLSTNMELFREIRFCLMFLADDIELSAHFLDEDKYNIFHCDEIEDFQNHIHTNYNYKIEYAAGPISLAMHMFKRKGSKNTRKKDDMIKTCWNAYVHNYPKNWHMWTCHDEYIGYSLARFDEHE